VLESSFSIKCSYDLSANRESFGLLLLYSLWSLDDVSVTSVVSLPGAAKRRSISIFSSPLKAIIKSEHEKRETSLSLLWSLEDLSCHSYIPSENTFQFYVLIFIARA
jgi:hypothetical protein